MGDMPVPGTHPGTHSLSALSAQVFPVGISPRLSDYILNETNQAIQSLVNNNFKCQ